ncbi:MAG: hypothetical protein LRY36_00225 [Alphaproteobacteria bacterium]|nr:hypothetical protein [Alphaproteobacteria bacterium]
MLSLPEKGILRVTLKDEKIIQKGALCDEYRLTLYEIVDGQKGELIGFVDTSDGEAGGYLSRLFEKAKLQEFIKELEITGVPVMSREKSGLELVEDAVEMQATYMTNDGNDSLFQSWSRPKEYRSCVPQHFVETNHLPIVRLWAFGYFCV